MLRTANTHIREPCLASDMARRWEAADRFASWEWNRIPFLMPRDPAVVTEAIRHPDLSRTKNIEAIIGPGVLASDDGPWREGRKIFRDLLSGPRVPEFCEATRWSLQQLHETLDTAAATGSVVNLYTLLTRAVIGAFTRYAFGAAANDEEWEQLEKVLAIVTVKIDALNMTPGTTAGELSHVRGEIAQAMEAIERIIQRLISRSLKETGTVPETAQILAEAERSGKFKESTAKSQMHNLILASFLTTGVLVSLATLEAALSEDLWERLAEEAKHAHAQSNPQSAEELNLPIATACIEETARLYPPVWLIGRKATKDLEIDGRLLKEGGIVYLFIFGLGRDERNWTDPLTWNVERFLAAKKPSEGVGSYEPFLSGKHICLGRTFARAEATVMISELARRYKIQPSHTGSLELTGTMFLFPTTTVPVTLTKR